MDWGKALQLNDLDIPILATVETPGWRKTQQLRTNWQAPHAIAYYPDTSLTGKKTHDI